MTEAIRLTLTGQQSDALAQLSEWDLANPTWKEWAAVLRLRNTLDWRDGRKAALAGSQALQQEYFRALVRAVNAGAGAQFLEEAGLEPDLVLCRIANESSLSVQNGHRFTMPLLRAEWAQAAKASGTDQSQDKAVLEAYLNTPAGSPVSEGKLEVAGPNLFGPFHQRHLMQSSDRLFRFLNDSWGVRDQAAQFAQFLQGLPDLRYKPFLMRMIGRSDSARQAAYPGCENLIINQPEIVTPALWRSARVDEDGKEVASAPDFHAWFSPEVPRGTAFETDARLIEIGVGDENDAVWLKTLWERAPYAYDLAKHNAYLANGGTYQNLSAAILSQWFGPLAEYHLTAMKRLAACSMDQPDLYAAAMNKAAAFDPNSYLKLGEYFVERQMPDRAAEAFLLGFAQADNRVWVANGAPWVVKYLFEKGEMTKAQEVADHAAEVYSYNGLKAAQWLQEQQGLWGEALQTGRKIDERYNDDKPVEESSCLIRLGEVDRKLTEENGYTEKVISVFPDGLKKAALGDFSAPPDKGVLINGTSKSMVPFGLERNMVIVGLNGYRTETFAQYAAIRSLSDAPQMSFIVWDGKSYRVSEGSLPGGRFGVDMIDYRPAAIER